MEKPDLFRTGVFVWLVLLSVGDIWQFNAIKKLSLLQTDSRDSSCEHQHEYQQNNDVIERVIHVADILHDDVEREFNVEHHIGVEYEPHADPVVEENMAFRFRQNERTLRNNHNVRENMKLSRLSVQKSKRKLASDSSIDEDTNNKDAEQKNIIQDTTHTTYTDPDFKTTCILLNNYEQNDENDIDENDFMAEFFLDFNIRTDKYPQETSWYLSPQHDNSIMVIDSLNENITTNLSANSIYTFEYHCVIVIKEEDQKKEISEPFCYDFYLYDSFGDGNCCHAGLGYFELNINNSTTPLISDRLYSFELGTQFCINNNGSLVDSKQLYDENERNHSNRYPSRECMNDTCVCDSNPPLFVSNNDNLHGIKMNVMSQMMSLSGSEKLTNINTPQYKAACWILKDDPYFIQQNISSISLKRIEERMIQRYILAVFYFATTGEKWTNDFFFLSNRSECEWNSVNGFYDYDYEYYYGNNLIEGSICDEDENVMSVVFRLNNLDGTIIEELYGLTKLEQLHLAANEKLRGSIPSTLGRLPELRSLLLFGTLLEGSIPPELFHALKMQYLNLGRNNLSSSLPEKIANLKKLSVLSLYENQLTGSIPESLYSLTSLIELELDDNNLSSTISPSISNLRRLKRLWLSKNNLTGEIPSSIIHLSRLNEIVINGNKLSGEIPKSLESLLDLVTLSLHNNRLNGAVSDELCDNDILSITTDCRNDVFLPDVSCSCCYFCTDETPQWNGKCSDTTLRIDFDHKERDFDFHANSDDLEWSLIDQSTSHIILYDGPYKKDALNNTRPSYKACAVNTGYYSLIMKSPPEYDTNYTIFWNDELIHSGTFLGYEENDGVYKYDNKTMVTFNYDPQVEKLIFNNTVCNGVRLTCGNNDEVFFIKQNTTERLMYSTALEISGMSQIQNTSSIQSKALCWIMQHENIHNKNIDNDILQTRFTQRYVLTILHLMSFNGLFGPNEYPPLSDECDWEGMQCKDNNTNIVTTISLSSSKGQIINGPLIDEIGSLAFVEVLRLSQTKLTGSIPLLLSNMWSLTELDLSSNSLSSSIPDSFFNQLTHLKYLNLSNNKFSSSIPSNIGSYSEISTIILSGNKLIGSVPLNNFNSLEHLDISENKLDSIDIKHLSNYTKLHTINLATNFFVGELHEDVFVSLPKLQYFNASQNELGGMIPSRFLDDSNITHFDVHQNQFKGPIPIGMTRLHNIHHLNLQGNKLTGSIPSQLNQLQSLDTIVLSHNELKGSIPFDTTSLQSIKRLHLQSNKLSGFAPLFSNMTSYITDCGFPYDSLNPISCASCDICCNADGECQRKRNETISISPTAQTVIFIFSVIALIVLLYIMKDSITSSRLLQSHFSNTVKNWNAIMLINDNSVYQFMLTRNKVGWMIAFACVIIQLMTLFLFVSAADIKSESGDLVYTMTCPSNSLECDNAKNVSSYGLWIFSFILAVWLLRDIVSSVKLMLLSFEKRNIDFLFTSGVIFLVTVLSAWTSIYYNMALGTKNTELIVNAVILLFVIEIDERLYQLASSCNPLWVAEIEGNTGESFNFDDEDLLLSSKIQEMSESFGKYRSKLSERIQSSLRR